MSAETDPIRTAYYSEANSWATDRERARSRWQRAAWVVAAVASTVALCEAVALVALMPLKTVVPYTLLVDRQTGFVQELKPLDRQTVAPDAALTRSLLAQYVIAREGFDIASLRDDYRKVALWSGGEERNQYVAGTRATNPSSSLATLPRQTLIQAEVRSISPLGNGTSLVRFVTTRTDPGGRVGAAVPWVAVISYRFSSGAMSAADRLANPLGFQVLRYRRDAEIPIAVPPAPNPVDLRTRLNNQTLSSQTPGNANVARNQP
jgi:type IV secretion system protein VirB8